MKAVITSASYTYHEVTLYGRGEDGSRVSKTFIPEKPYYFIEGEGEYRSLDDKSLQKIIVDNPLQVRTERRQYDKTWEADIRFVERVWHDMGFKKSVDLDTLQPVEFYTELRKNYIDIEVDDSEGFPDPDKAEKTVLCYTIIDNYTGMATIHTLKPFLTLELLEKIGHMRFKLFFYDNEFNMLQRLQLILSSKFQPDVILGWNVDEFDVKYLINRMKKLGIDTSCWNNILIFDLLKAYRRWKENKQKSYKLDYISMQELGYGKVVRKEKVIKMNGLDMAYYNYFDSQLCYDLDNKLGIFKYFYDLSEFAGTLDISRWNASYIWDSVLLNELHGTPYKLPTAEKDEKIGVNGGYVLTAIKGFFTKVKVLDFKSEYPNIMITFNMSPDSIDVNGDIIFPMVRFRSKPIGLIPRLLKNFISRRDDIKKAMTGFPKDSMKYKSMDNAQRVLKEITNAIYGLLGNEHYRLYDERIQAAVTYAAREHIKYVVEWLKRKGVKVLYGDTDSVMIQTDMDMPALMKELNKSFNDFTKQFGVENTGLYMKFEKEYDAWIQLGTKKRYIGIVDGKLDYRGIELRRSDNSDYTQWVEEKYFTKLFLTDKEFKQGKKDALNFYNEQLKRFDGRDQTLIPDIGLWQSLRSDMKYDKKYWVVEAVKTSINKYHLNIDYSLGRVKIYYINSGEAIAIGVNDDLPKNFHKLLDYNYHKARCLTNPLEEFVELVSPAQGFNSMESTIDDIKPTVKSTSDFRAWD